MSPLRVAREVERTPTFSGRRGVELPKGNAEASCRSKVTVLAVGKSLEERGTSAGESRRMPTMHLIIYEFNPIEGPRRKTPTQGRYLHQRKDKILSISQQSQNERTTST